MHNNDLKPDGTKSTVQDNPIPFLCNPWIHASKTRLQSKSEWVSGSLKKQSHPSSQITLPGKKGEDNVRLTIEFGRGNPDPSKDIDIKTSISTSNEYLQNLRDMLSDSFDAYLYFWDMRAKYATDTVEVTERELAEILGLEVQKNGAYHPKTRKELDKITKMWDAIKADVKISIKKSTRAGKETERYLTLKGRFFEHSRWEEGEVEDNIEKWSRVSWKYRIGHVLVPFLESPNRSLAYIPKKILQYRGNHLKITKRIGRSCLYLLRSGANTDSNRVATIEEIFSDAGIDLSRRTRSNLEQFEDARERLVKDGIFQSLDYKNPDDAVYFDKVLRGHNDSRFKNRWLKAQLVIKPVLEKNDRKVVEEAHPIVVQDTLDTLVADLKKYLAWSNSSKSKLASNIGIGNSSLSMLLNQTRKPSRGNKVKIETFLSTIEHLPYRN